MKQTTFIELKSNHQLNYRGAILGGIFYARKEIDNLNGLKSNVLYSDMKLKIPNK